MTALEELRQLAGEAATIGSAAAVLAWDQETHLPSAGHDWRARQLAWLSGRRHELVSSDRWRERLAQAAAEPAGSPREAGTLREMQRRFERARRLPTALVERDSELCARAKHAWAGAREHADFSRFAPFLRQLVELAREKAERWGYPERPYDALLEEYEPGLTTAAARAILDPLGREQAPLAAAAVERSRAHPATLPAGPYPVAAQQAFNCEVAESLGFDFQRGRIDTTAHPFCTTLGPADVRLTTRYDESDFTSSLFGVMHEAGHGLYEQGLEADDFGLPAGEAVSLGIHESQSRLWENQVGRSRSFWEHWLPVARGHFPQLADVSLDDFLAAIRRTERGFIRVEADEANYDLHILLRFDLERRIFAGELAVDELPAAWNERFRELFGLEPPDDARGCLQDIHWAMGGFGYFPTYTLGNLNAAQLHEAAMRDPAIAASAARADYAPLLAWLRSQVHHPGATVAPAEIIRRATGSEPAADAHLRHLRARYLAPSDAALT